MRNNSVNRALVWCAILLLGWFAPFTAASEPSAPIRVLMLGDDGHHRPADFAKALTPVLANEQITLTYSDDVGALNTTNLKQFDCLLLYLNTTELPAASETALMDFVAQGKGLVAVHCASYAFLNSTKYLHLVGGRFKSHDTGTFRTRIIDAQHPAMRGVSSFESWDETYVHSDLADDIHVLMVRPHDGIYEPWTWVRNEGKGRVFYTASGHDEKTWNNPGFQKLVSAGIKWASGRVQDDAPPIPTTHVELPPSVKEGGASMDIPQPVSPEVSMRHMHLPEGFHVELVAAEPDIIKPVSMAFDERGRLWVVETQDYPETILPPGTPGHDRIVICEDTKATGKMDKFTVFADHLNLPQGISLANGGAVVAMSPDILFLKDSTGGDHADVKQVLYTGFGRSDTHAMHGNFQYGLDNWIWATCGYSGLKVKVGADDYRSNQCLFRFRADKPGFEIITPTSNNTWGLGFNESGEVFASTANNSHSLFLAIPNRYFESVRGWSGIGIAEIEDHKKAHAIGDVRQWDVNGGFTAACGHTVYTARAFPPEYWDKASFCCEPTEHIIHVDLLSSAGSGYVAHDGYNLLASDDSYVSPIQSVVGPDGSLYFIDWYTYVVQHNPTPVGFHTGPGGAYVTPLRDKKHGRIYKIVYKGPKQNNPIQSLDRANVPALLAALKSDNQLWRLQAQRLLVERQQTDVVPDLIALASDTHVDATGSNPAALHALWTLHGLGALDSSSLSRYSGGGLGRGPDVLTATVAALNHPAAGVREAALAVLPRTADSLQAILAAHLLSDADLHVRRLALLAIAEMPASQDAGLAVWNALQDESNSKDHWLTDAATAAAARSDLAFLNVAAQKEHSVQPAPAEPPTSNLIPNGDFARIDGAAPQNWRNNIYSGAAEFAIDKGRAGAAVKITSANGADAGWITTFKVEPHTRYQLSGWIKTENLKTTSGLGALFNVHQLQNPRVITPPLTGTHDWSHVQVNFDSGDYRELSVNCLFGGWGHAAGAAWYEDVRVERAAGAESPGTPVVRIVANHYARGSPVDSIGPLLSNVKSAGPQTATVILEGLAAGWPDTAVPKTDNLATLLADCLPAIPPQRQDVIVQLANRWNVKSDAIAKAGAAALINVRNELSDPASTDMQRIYAAERLVGGADDAGTVDAIVKQIKPQNTQALSVGLIRALGKARDPSAANALVGRWRFLAPSSRSEAIDAFLHKPQWTNALLDAMEKDTIARADLSNQQLGSLTGNSDKAIADRATAILARRGQLPSADRQKIVDAFAAVAKSKGDIAKGQQVFLKNCAVCHTYNNTGGQVGPNLTGVMKGNKSDILIAILDPSRSVEGNYRMWVVATKKGDTYGGRLVAETRNAFDMLDTTGKPHTILRDDVDRMAMQNKSIMPDGFESLGADQLTDVIEFLSQPTEGLKQP